jgi:hypothetical protein
MNYSLCMYVLKGYELAKRFGEGEKIDITMGVVPALPCRTELHSAGSLSTIVECGDRQQDGIPASSMVNTNV